MLRKFTREPKAKLEDILCELADANEALKAFIPDLVKKFRADYDEFIAQVGHEVEAFLREKLTPLPEESEFWQALINEKGKPRSKGETYTDNVCQTYRRMLHDLSMNAFLESTSKSNWANLVMGVLHYFGE